jgi:hypothetical protein
MSISILFDFTVNGITGNHVSGFVHLFQRNVRVFFSAVNKFLSSFSLGAAIVEKTTTRLVPQVDYRIFQHTKRSVGF